MQNQKGTRAIDTASGSPLAFVSLALAGALLCSGCHKKQSNTLEKLPTVANVLSIPGSVDVDTRRPVTTPNIGVVDLQLAREGMFVHSGQLLARIGSRDLELRLRTAQMKLAALLRQRQDMLARYHPTRQITANPTAGLDIEMARTQLQIARSQLASARKAFVKRTTPRANLDAAQRQMLSAQQDLQAAAAQLGGAEAQLQLQTNRRDSVLALYQSASASREELRTAQDTWTQAVDKVNAARAAYNRALLGIDGARAAVNAAGQAYQDPEDLKNAITTASQHVMEAEAAYDRALAGATPQVGAASEPPDVGSIDTSIIEAQGEVNAAKEDIDRMSIVAPMTGTLISWTINQGENVQPGQALGTVVDLTHLKVTSDVRPEVGQYMLPGTAVDVIMKGPPERKFKGVVSGIAPLIDPQSGTQKLTVEVYDPTRTLVPGAEVSIEKETKH